jgi:pimeloyl-ACP methyl ester carboxylesterase
MSTATYVLVHGGGHGGWCYQRVARILRAAGHEVYTPTLTGLGERAHLVTPDIDLDTHIQDIVAVLEYEDLHEVILAGHSYGGLVVTGAADRVPGRIGRLVYLDAGIPEDGQSLDDMAAGLMSEARRDARVVDGVELVLWPNSVSVRHYGVTDPDDAAWMQSKLTPHPWKCFGQPIRLKDAEAVKRIPRTEVWCTAMRAPRPEGEPLPEGVHELDTGHDLMITEPRATAEILLGLA